MLTIHTGSAFLWASIFAGPLQGILNGVAYSFWALSMLPVLFDLGRTMRDGLAKLEREPFIPTPSDRGAAD